MKKITILPITLLALTMGSCKKERTCKCITMSTAPGSVTSEQTIVFKKITKSNAKAACMSFKVTPDGETDTETRTCTLSK